MKRNVFSKIILSTVVLSGAVASPYMVHDQLVHAAEQQKDKFGELHKVNSSEGYIKLEDGYTYKVKNNGTATITKVDTRETKKLPKSAEDKNGKNVLLSYVNTNHGLKLMVIDESKSTNERGWKGALKCGLGVAGGAGTVGLGGFGVGGPGGAVVGAVSGGMSGAAASCF
ncbi:hypothetical protein BU582_05120 [Staphylococcus agnetis]|uniref:hypothetical protein n=1 Tax=Staphylococcus agnetis TaxID=985762 RepID=UPI000D19FA0C|nr:hypothetical protein [Staphylococcus agnetis]PTH67851.1 hypothetical protein BU582_05120 [Staphylococcus agnetis]